jgi:hypothetical protein
MRIDVWLKYDRHFVVNFHRSELSIRLRRRLPAKSKPSPFRYQYLVILEVANTIREPICLKILEKIGNRV